MAIFVKISKFINSTKLLERPVEVLILILDFIFEKFVPFNNASGIYVCYQKVKYPQHYGVDPMKICFLSGAFPPINDGIGDYTAKLIKSLKKMGMEASLIGGAFEASELDAKAAINQASYLAAAI